MASSSLYEAIALKQGDGPTPYKTYKKSGKKMRHVRSGIGLAGLDGKPVTGEHGSFLTSRTARVLLAGAGFLADAVRRKDVKFSFLSI